MKDRQAAIALGKALGSDGVQACASCHFRAGADPRSKNRGPDLTDDEIDAITAWLETLTDERVLRRRAPFDHPQLFVPNGHRGDERRAFDRGGDRIAEDDLVEIPAVGAAGGPPLPGFLEGVFGPPPQKRGKPRYPSRFWR